MEPCPPGRTTLPRRGRRFAGGVCQLADRPAGNDPACSRTLARQPSVPSSESAFLHIIFWSVKLFLIAPMPIRKRPLSKTSLAPPLRAPERGVRPPGRIGDLSR